ncbi:MAG: carbon-nitrogen hydrolase family protein [Leptonema sp. (in: Bacteria)]|nr:carbon-nitrogen hydrolase family protein [Leptonema sp. (in: bacteria)]
MTKVVAVQMQGRVADVSYNLAHIRELLDEAIRFNPKIIALPEFFTTPIVQDNRLWGCSLPPENQALELLKEYAQNYQVFIGGSYLEKRNHDVYNCYTLVQPDGTITRHDKDLPTMIENAYYKGGNDDGFHQTSLGKVGTAVCWETIRTQTVKRLIGRIDFLMTGSHWWAPPVDWVVLKQFLKTMDQMNRQIMYETPSRFARLLGVANIHAAHSGKLNGKLPTIPLNRFSLPFNSYLIGETQIIDNKGEIVARMSVEEGAGVISADINLKPSKPSEALTNRFWIPKLPLRFHFFWHQQNWSAKGLYRYAKKNNLLKAL